MKKLQDKLIEVGNKLATQRHLQSISFGLMAIMPLTILGVFSSLFQHYQIYFHSYLVIVRR